MADSEPAEASVGHVPWLQAQMCATDMGGPAKMRGGKAFTECKVQIIKYKEKKGKRLG